MLRPRTQLRRGARGRRGRRGLLRRSRRVLQGLELLRHAPPKICVKGLELLRHALLEFCDDLRLRLRELIHRRRPGGLRSGGPSSKGLRGLIRWRRRRKLSRQRLRRPPWRRHGRRSLRLRELVHGRRPRGLRGGGPSSSGGLRGLVRWWHRRKPPRWRLRSPPRRRNGRRRLRLRELLHGRRPRGVRSRGPGRKRLRGLIQWRRRWRPPRWWLGRRARRRHRRRGLRRRWHPQLDPKRRGLRTLELRKELPALLVELVPGSDLFVLRALPLKLGLKQLGFVLYSALWRLRSVR